MCRRNPLLPPGALGHGVYHRKGANESKLEPILMPNVKWTALLFTLYLHLLAGGESDNNVIPSVHQKSKYGFFVNPSLLCGNAVQLSIVSQRSLHVCHIPSESLSILRF